jgi:hypothetical protein
MVAKRFCDRCGDELTHIKFNVDVHPVIDGLGQEINMSKEICLSCKKELNQWFKDGY